MVFIYTACPQGPDLSSVWYGPVPLRYGVDFVIEGDFRAKEIGEYEFAIVGIGNFEGRREFKWWIVPPTRPLAPDALKIPGGMCAPHWGVIGCDGRSAVVLDATKLMYDPCGEKWIAPLTVDWPQNIDGLLCTPAFYTDPVHAQVSTDCGEVFLVTSTFRRPLALCPEEYVVKVLWMPSFTMEDVKNAFYAGKDELVFELTVGSPAWACDPFGLKTTTYRLIVPLKGLIVDDEVIDWYWIEYLGNGADSGSMAIERRLISDVKRLTDCAYKKSGYNLMGWSFDSAAASLADVDFADRQFVSDEFEVGVTNTIYATWTTDYVMSGDVSGEQYATVSSVYAWGVGSTADDAIYGRVFGKQDPWRYVVVVPAKGAYDVAVNAEGVDGAGITTTVLVIASSDPEVGSKSETPIQDPGGDISSTIDNTGAGDFPAVVGGVDQIARNAVSTEEKSHVVELRFTVTDMPAKDSTVGYTRIRKEVPCGCAKPLDFTLAKYIDGLFVQKLHDLSIFHGKVQVVMPFKRGARRNLRVARYHEDTDGDASTGSVKVLPEGLDNADDLGECFEIDDTTGEIIIVGSKLSTYAILWDGAVVSMDSLVWNVDWLSGMYVPEIKLSVKEGDGWANTVENMCFLLEKRNGVRLWDGKKNVEISDVVTMNGVQFYRVRLRDRFVENNIEGPDSAVWGAAWFDANWVNAALSEILLYAPSYWPNNPKDVPEINNLVAYVAYESCDCDPSYLKVGANKSLMKSLSAVAPKLMSAPVGVASLNASLAVGAAVTPDSEPYCKLVGFSVENGVVSGTVEVGAGDDKGSLGTNAVVELLGAKSISDGFTKIATANCDKDGNFTVVPPKGYMFFKVKLSIAESAK